MVGPIVSGFLRSLGFRTAARSLPRPFSPLRLEALEERQMLAVVGLTDLWAIRPAGLAPDAYEADNTPAQARTIAVNGAAQTHSIHAAGDVDYVQFTLAAAGNVVVQTSGRTGDTELRLYNGSGALLAYDDDSGTGLFSRIAVTNLRAGTYYARVNEYGNNGTISAYAIQVGGTAVPAGDAYEPDNSEAQANAIALGATQTHSIHAVGDVDWVRFTVGATTSVVVQTAGAAGDTELALYDGSGRQIAYDDDSGTGYFSRIATSLPAGTYYARVNEYGNNGTIASYTIQVTGSTPTSDPPRGTSYMLVDAWGGTWTDADKSARNTDDDNLCWAATTANMLQWTGWGNVAGLTTADEIFAYFQNHWSDQGGHVYYGGDWWFDGSNDMQGRSGWAQVEQSGGGFFPALDFDNYVHYTGQPSQSMSAIDSYLHSGYAVGLGLSGPGGHAVTCWGFEYATGSTSTYTGVYITDSDDNQSTPGSENLRFYAVSQSNGRWHLQDYYGSNQWYIADVTGLEPRSAATNAAIASAIAPRFTRAPVRVMLRCGATESDAEPIRVQTDLVEDRPETGPSAQALLALQQGSCAPVKAVASVSPTDRLSRSAALDAVLILSPSDTEDDAPDDLSLTPDAHLPHAAADALFARA